MVNELYHHGIKGQRWGVKNGPPYPLKPSQRSAAEKRRIGGTNVKKGEDGPEESGKKQKKKREPTHYQEFVRSHSIPWRIWNRLKKELGFGYKVGPNKTIVNMDRLQMRRAVTNFIRRRIGSASPQQTKVGSKALDIILDEIGNEKAVRR